MARKQILGREVSALRTGFVDTSRGAVLTCPEALAVAKHKAESDTRKLEAKRLALNRHEARQAVLEAQREKQRVREFDYVCVRLALLARMPVVTFKAQLRTLKERRAVACINAAQKVRGARLALIANAREGDKPLSMLANVACDNT